MAEIGHMVVPCPRCAVPRHVPFDAKIQPFPMPGTWAFQVRRGEEVLGQVHVLVTALPDKHACGTRPPTQGLSIVPNPEENHRG